MSALVAVAAQACGVTRLGFVNPSLYAMASTGFVDVTTGNNDLYNVGEYSAAPGYDMASGLGSPDGARVLSRASARRRSRRARAPSRSRARAAHRTPTRSDHHGDAAQRGGETHRQHRRRGDGDRPGGHAQHRRRRGTDAAASAPSTTRQRRERRREFHRWFADRPGRRRDGHLQGPDDLHDDVTFLCGHATIHAPSCSVDRQTRTPRGRIRPHREADRAQTGAAPSPSYQYSINGGRTWMAIAQGRRVPSTSTKLAKGRAYRVDRARPERRGPLAAVGARRSRYPFVAYTRCGACPGRWGPRS